MLIGLLGNIDQQIRFQDVAAVHLGVIGMAEIHRKETVVIRPLGKLIIQNSFAIKQTDGGAFRTGVGIVLIPQTAINRAGKTMLGQPVVNIIQKHGDPGAHVVGYIVPFHGAGQIAARDHVGAKTEIQYA